MLNGVSIKQEKVEQMEPEQLEQSETGDKTAKYGRMWLYNAIQRTGT